MGAGFLTVREERKSSIVAPVVSWGYGFDPRERDTDSGCGGSRWQHELEFFGCTERCPQMVLPELLEFRESLGGDSAIWQRARDILLYARERIAAVGFAPANPINPQLSGSLASFEFPKVDTIKARDWFWNKHRIECPVNIGGGRYFLRVSTAWFVTTDDIDALANALKSFPASL